MARAVEREESSVQDIAWNSILAPYKRADNRLAVAQLSNTAIPFVALWYLALKSQTRFSTRRGIGPPWLIPCAGQWH